MEHIMPIRSLLSQTSFNPDQTEMISKAFDEACAQLQRGKVDPAMSSLVRTALAKRIIERANRGEMTANKLRDDAARGFFARGCARSSGKGAGAKLSHYATVELCPTSSHKFPIQSSDAGHRRLAGFN
jgi:hypothetical protein